ncbi:kelch repeat-containing protein [Sorangium sp. So ce1036]|uniref:Kelch repeat-containing protein n=1 Tax=Sorangium sp. So ce1036 TaxID=3133328 RepID=UPI003F045251
MPTPSWRPRRAAPFSCLAAALLLPGCGAEHEDSAAAALRLRFPDHAESVLAAREAFAPAADGFRLPASAQGGAWVGAARPEVALPREGGGPIRFRRPDGGEIRVRELGAEGEGRMAERAVSYRRAGGTSFWTATDHGVEEWLLLGEGVARGGEAAAAWEVEGATPRPRGAAVELLDEESGAPVLRVTAPRAHAASGRPVAPALRVRGARIELVVDAGGEAVLVDPAWELAGAMGSERRDHTATLLPSGKVLVAGGANTVPLDTAELYDPETDTWTPTQGTMHLARRQHTATRLPGGQVLVLGGYGGTSGRSDLWSAELYDPETDTWTLLETRLKQARHQHTATLLESGLVLVAGGRAQGTPLKSAELYNPTGESTPPTPDVPAMENDRYLHTATLLDSGKVLLVGGLGTTRATGAALYDPESNTWARTPPGDTARVDHTATRLEDGRVLVAGGSSEEDKSKLLRAALYDPGANAWTDAPSMRVRRVDHAAARLHDGAVLVTGGDDEIAAFEAELYDPEANTWTPAPRMRSGHLQHTATVLLDRRVLVAGPEVHSEVYTGVGVACASDAECALGLCVEGVCCESRCAEPCRTCARSDAPGRCVPQPKGSDLRGDCARAGCDGACDGFGACTAVRPGDACSPARCSDDGTQRLGSLVCPAAGAACPDPAREPRARVDCAPYRCDRATSDCKERCSSLQDCAPGFACDLSGRCVSPPPRGKGGCSLAGAGAAGPLESGLGAALLALLALGKRRSLALRSR